MNHRKLDPANKTYLVTIKQYSKVVKMKHSYNMLSLSPSPFTRHAQLNYNVTPLIEGKKKTDHIKLNSLNID